MSALQRGAGLRNLASTSRRQLKSPNPHRHIFTQSSETKRTPIRTGLYTTAFILSSGLFVVYYFDARSALHRYFITPVVRNLFDAETGHKIAVKSLKSGLAPRDPVVDEVRLKAKVSPRVYAVINPYLIRLDKIWDEEVSNPIGLAAGFDKDGEAIDGMRTALQGQFYII